MTGTLVVVGVGPGDPALMTRAAVEAVEGARVLAYPTTRGTGFARRIAAQHVPPEAEEIPFAVPMTGDGAAEAAYDAAAEILAAHLHAGRDVVLLCEGDPMLFGSAASLVERLGAEGTVRVVPGITAASAAAAATATSLARKDEPFTVMPASAPRARIQAMLKAGGGIVFYKVSARFDDIAALVRQTGRTGTLVIRGTLPDERIVPLDAAEPGAKPYFSLVLVPPADASAPRHARDTADCPRKAVILALTPSALETARAARKALSVAGLPAAIHGRADRIAPEAVDRVFTALEPHARALFDAGIGIVGLMSSGILIRVLSSAIGRKQDDPPVIAMAEDGSAIVPLLGAHRDGRLMAEALSGAFGTPPAHTTLSEVRFGQSLEEPPEGWVVADRTPFKALAADLAAGSGIAPDPGLGFLDGLPGGRSPVRATTHLLSDSDRVPTYVRRGIALGMGAERGAEPAAAVAHADAVLASRGIDPRAVAVVATLDVKADEPAIAAVAQHLGAALRVFDAETLAREAPNLATPSEAVRAAVGVPGVAEAAALAACRGAGRLIAPKDVSGRTTVALAEAPEPLSPDAGRARGHLAVVGIGPGAAGWRTPECVNLLSVADDYVGYSLYLDLVEDVRTHQARFDYALGDETERVRFALERAGEGRTVALISSGDPGIYAMATLAAELLETGDLSDAARRVALTIAPGVSAAQAAASRVGAPLGHDFAFVSLSDLMTPWSAIEKRLEAVATADFAVALYNPRSMRRTAQLERAVAIISARRPPETPVVVACSVGRPSEGIIHTTLAEFDTNTVDMLATVIIGASTTRRFVRGSGDALVYTPRGYEVSS